MGFSGSVPSFAAAGGGVALAIVMLAGCSGNSSASGASNSAVFTPAPPGEGDSPQQACIAAGSAWSTFNATYMGGGPSDAEVATRAHDAFDSISTQLTTYVDYFPEAGHYDIQEAMMSYTGTIVSDFANLVALSSGQKPTYPPLPANSADAVTQLTKDYGAFRSECAKVITP